MADTEAIEHFREGRRSLLRQRQELEGAIRDVEKIIALLERSGPSASAAAPAPSVPPDSPPTVRQAVVMVLEREPRDLPFAEILAEIQFLGVTAADASVRSIMAKMAERGEIAKGAARGSYRTSSAPAEAGAEVSDSVTEGGG